MDGLDSRYPNDLGAEGMCAITCKSRESITIKPIAGDIDLERNRRWKLLVTTVAVLVVTCYQRPWSAGRTLSRPPYRSYLLSSSGLSLVLPDWRAFLAHSPLLLVLLVTGFETLRLCILNEHHPVFSYAPATVETGYRLRYGSLGC